jgi:hypothetical protein
MIARRKKETFIKGTATHRRTEGDYMGVLLDAVTLDDWRDVARGKLQAAKDGDPAARNWLAQYLVGKPGANAPTPLAVVGQQWSGDDPVAEKLAKPIIDRTLYPSLYGNQAFQEDLRALIDAELADKLPKFPK